MVTTVYTDSVLEINKRYTVQQISKFPKAREYMIGQQCVLKQIVGTTARVMFTGRMCEIPIRSLIEVTGYHAQVVHAKNADGFVVNSQNSLGLAVGTAYLNHNKEKSDSKNIVMDIKGKEVKIPFEILTALVSNKRKEKPIKSEKIAEKTGFTPVMVEVMGELLAPHENREDNDFIPASIKKLLPGVNLVELRDLLRTEEDVWYDMEGNDHKTIAEVDKANTKIRNRIFKDRMIALSAKRLSDDWDKGHD